MEMSDILATSALVVSIFSAWVSYRAYRQSADFSECGAERQFSRERSEFLVRIQRATKLFEDSERRIGRLLANIEDQPESIKAELQGEVERLRADLRHLEGCLRQSRSLWHENYEISHDGFAAHKPKHLALLEDDERFVERALKRLEEAEEKLDTSLSLHDPLVR